MLAFLLILFIVAFPLLTKFLVGTFSPSSAKSTASSSSSTKVEEKQNTTSSATTATTTTASATTKKENTTNKDAPLKTIVETNQVVAKQEKETVQPVVVEQPQQPSVVTIDATTTATTIEKVTPVAEAAVVVAVEEKQPAVVAEVVVPTESQPSSTHVEESTPAVTVQEEQPVDNVQEEQDNELVDETVPVEDQPIIAQQQEEETVQSTATKEQEEQEAGEFVSNLNVEQSSFIIKPSNISKYLIGQKGATINKIKEETQSKIDMSPIDDDSTLVTISAKGDEFDLQKTYKRLCDELKNYGWEFDKNENQFVEHLTESMKLFKELEKKISDESKLMSDCFERASKAHDSGDGALAKQLSEEGKQHQDLMKKYQQESAQTMFEHLNSERAQTEIDLHGQYVENAMNFLKLRIEKLRGESISQLTIIYGAGNHSDEKGPKIKPAVLNYLKENGITYEEQTQGSILANI